MDNMQMNHQANRPAVSAAMKDFLANMRELGLSPMREGSSAAWRREGAGGMNVIVFNALDPMDAEFKHPVQIAIALDSGRDEIVVSQRITYPSSAKVILERLVEISDEMRYERPEKVDGFQPDSRLFLRDHEGLYVSVQRDDPALGDRPLYVAFQRDDEAQSLDCLGQSPELHKAFLMVQKAQPQLAATMPPMTP